MPKKIVSQETRDALRQSALANHAARKALAAGLPEAAVVPPVATPLAPEAAAAIVEAAIVEAANAPALLSEPAVVALRPAQVGAAPVVVTGPAVITPSPAQSSGPTPPLTSKAAFTLWLRSKVGRDACDTRMSSDPVRFGAELEDRLWVAWTAALASRS